jgi:hypothetical protein
MRILLALLFLTAFVMAGCARKQEAVFKPVASPAHATASSDPAAAQAPTVLPITSARSTPILTPGSSLAGAAPAPAVTPVASAPGTLIVTPGSGLTGKVARYNDAGRFVVLEFPVAHMPALQQQLFVYRNGLKVGELKVTGPQRDDHTVADLTTGEAQAGDEVRDR